MSNQFLSFVTVTFRCPAYLLQRIEEETDRDVGYPNRSETMRDLIEEAIAARKAKRARKR